MNSALPKLASIPSVDRVLVLPAVVALIAQYGRDAVTAAVRDDLGDLRNALRAGLPSAPAQPDSVAARVAARLRAADLPSLRPLFNLTGTILHTNFGRAVLPQEVASAVAAAATHAVNLEFDLESGKRGDRDRHVASRLARMAGAEMATVVNNNAAAVLLVLSTLAQRREVIVSRGELIEIGGEFRMPEIMKRAGCRLVEVGTTNRTHLRDYADAVGPRTALIMKVHPSNFQIVGFTKAVDEAALAALAHEHALPLVCDLGAGALLDLRRWGLPYESTPAAMIAAGVDLVTFSGDKLLGGPQAGMIVGRGELVRRLNRNALKRAVRVDKLRMAALEALLKLYENPDELAGRIPTLRHMVRPPPEIEAQALRVLPRVAGALAGLASVSIEKCDSQVGSGSLPADRLPSFALAIRPANVRQSTTQVERLARAFRNLPVAVVGRVHDGAFLLDLRCLDEEDGFLAQLEHFHPGAAAQGK